MKEGVGWWFEGRTEVQVLEPVGDREHLVREDKLRERDIGELLVGQLRLRVAFGGGKS